MGTIRLLTWNNGVERQHTHEQILTATTLQKYTLSTTFRLPFVRVCSIHHVDESLEVQHGDDRNHVPTKVVDLIAGRHLHPLHLPRRSVVEVVQPSFSI